MSAAPTVLDEGAWGGEQVVLMVRADKAVLRLGCAEGELPAPILLDANGRFSKPGLYASFDGGPSPAGGEPAVKAQYDGRIEGSTMTLTVRHGASTDTYRLTHGMQSKIIRCL